MRLRYVGTIGKSSGITISLNFNASVDGRAVTAEHAENAEDWISLKTLHPLRSAFGAALQTAVINHGIFRPCHARVTCGKQIPSICVHLCKSVAVKGF